MQALCLMWRGEELVRADVLRVVAAGDHSAAVRAKLKTLWACDCTTSDRCTIYLCEGCKLVLAGGDSVVGG